MGPPADIVKLFDRIAVGDNATYLLSGARLLARCNAACERFVRDHGSEPLVAALPIAPALGTPWEHDHAVVTPAGPQRLRSIVYPFGDWLVVTHALLVEQPADDDYRDRSLIMMCVHCRRVRHRDRAERWDWVPSYVAAPPERVSHGLCPLCDRFYYDADED